MSEGHHEPKGADLQFWIALDVRIHQESKGTEGSSQGPPLRRLGSDAPLRTRRRDGGHTMRLRIIHIPQKHPRIGNTNM